MRRELTFTSWLILCIVGMLCIVMLILWVVNMNQIDSNAEFRRFSIVSPQHGFRNREMQILIGQGR